MNQKGTGKFGNGMMRVFLFLENSLCSVCGSRIGPFGYAYDLPEWYRRAKGYGPFKNEIHCPTCHAKSEHENYGNCQHCKQRDSSPFDVQYYVDRVVEAYEQDGVTSAKFEGRWFPEYIKAGILLMESGGTPTRDWAIKQPEIHEKILG